MVYCKAHGQEHSCPVIWKVLSANSDLAHRVWGAPVGDAAHGLVVLQSRQHQIGESEENKTWMTKKVRNGICISGQSITIARKTIAKNESLAAYLPTGQSCAKRKSYEKALITTALPSHDRSDFEGFCQSTPLRQ